MLVIVDKNTAFQVQQLDSITGAIVENIGYTLRRDKIITAFQLRQTKNTLTHVHGSVTKPKSICFVEYKHKPFGQRL